MGDMAEDFNALREARREKRAANRESSAAILREHDIEFVEKNGGTHLIVGDYDFWPGTGLFVNRKTRERGRGVYKLIKRIT